LTGRGENVAFGHGDYRLTTEKENTTTSSDRSCSRSGLRNKINDYPSELVGRVRNSAREYCGEHSLIDPHLIIAGRADGRVSTRSTVNPSWRSSNALNRNNGTTIITCSHDSTDHQQDEQSVYLQVKDGVLIRDDGVGGQYFRAR